MKDNNLCIRVGPTASEFSVNMPPWALSFKFIKEGKAFINIFDYRTDFPAMECTA